MSRAQDCAAYAGNLARDAALDMVREDFAVAYKRLQQARLELDQAITHFQVHHPEAVFDANRISRQAAEAHIRAEARAAYHLSRAEGLAASGTLTRF